MVSAIELSGWSIGKVQWKTLKSHFSNCNIGVMFQQCVSSTKYIRWEWNICIHYEEQKLYLLSIIWEDQDEERKKSLYQDRERSSIYEAFFPSTPGCGILSFRKLRYQACNRSKLSSPKPIAGSTNLIIFIMRQVFYVSFIPCCLLQINFPRKLVLGKWIIYIEL